MTQQGQPVESIPAPISAIRELGSAHDDLARLLALLNEAFDELLTSFTAVQSAAVSGGNAADMERFANRAITALQCGDLASQLIGFTQQRLTIVGESLKILSQLPHIALTNAASVAGNGASVGVAMAAPVQQDAMRAGTIDLF